MGHDEGAKRMLLRHAIGSALRRLRLERGMTIRQLSERARVSLPYISEVERGRKEASSEILATMCVVLGLSMQDLVDETWREFAAEARGGFVAERRPVLELRIVGTDAAGDAHERRHAAGVTSIDGVARSTRGEAVLLAA